MERMLGRVGERRIKRVRKQEKDKERETGKNTKRQIFPFCAHLAVIGHSKDRTVLVDQSCQQIQHGRDGAILK